MIATEFTTIRGLESEEKEEVEAEGGARMEQDEGDRLGGWWNWMMKKGGMNKEREEKRKG